MWAWMAIALGVAIAFYAYNKSKSGTTSTSSTAATDSAAGGVDSSLVPQFVNQTYVNNTPPTATATTAQTTPVSTPGSPLNEILTQGHTISPSASKAVIGWTISQQSPNATQLEVVLNGPGAKNQTRYIPASATTATFDDLQPGHTYVAAITPVDSAGQAVGGPNNVTFVTSK